VIAADIRGKPPEGRYDKRARARSSMISKPRKQRRNFERDAYAEMHIPAKH
jgi:hypothetical protein